MNEREAATDHSVLAEYLSARNDLGNLIKRYRRARGNGVLNLEPEMRAVSQRKKAASQELTRRGIEVPR